MVEPEDESAKIGYLTGDISEEEALRLEEKYFSSDDAHEELRALEDELIYDYAFGKLTPEQRRQVEVRLLGTEAGQNKLRVAQALSAKLIQRIGSDATGLAETRLPALEFQRTGYLAWAAALVIMICAAWLLISRLQPRPESPAVVERSPVPPERSKPSVGPPIRDQAADLTRGTPKLPVPTQVRDKQSSLMIALTPGGLRSQDQRSPVRITHGTRQVVFSLTLPASARGYEAFNVVLEKAGGPAVFRRDKIKAHRPSPEQVVVSFSLQAERLSPGDYLMILSGITPAGVAEEVADYAFTIRH